MKRFGVNIVRTITIEQTVYVEALNREQAKDKVNTHHADGKFGYPAVEFRSARGFAKDAEGGDTEEKIEIDDIWPSED